MTWGPGGGLGCRQTAPKSAMPFPTLHKSGCMVTMAETASDNCSKHGGIDWSRNNAVKKSFKYLICGEQVENKQKVNPQCSKVLPSKVEVAEELPEESGDTNTNTDENTNTQKGNSICKISKKQTTTWSD